MTQDKLAEAYRQLAAAIREVSMLEGAKGILTDWIVVSAHQYYSDEGKARTQIGQWLPDGEELPYHRVMGLLDYAITLRRHEITE